MILTLILFAIASVNREVMLSLADTGRGAWINAIVDVTAAGVNIPFLLFTIYLVWEIFRLSWKFVDEKAIIATTTQLIPHRSLLIKPMAWTMIEDVGVGMKGRTLSLNIKLRTGRVYTIRGLDNHNNAIEKFSVHARKLIHERPLDG